MKHTGGEDIRDNKQVLQQNSDFQYSVREDFENMGKTSYGRKAVCVDEIISAVRSCHICEDSPTTSDLSIILGNIRLDTTNDGEIHQPSTKVTQLERYQELRNRNEVSRVGQDVEIKVLEEDTIPDNLVKLDAPSFDDYEEDNDEEGSGEDSDDHLEERGPRFGVPTRCSGYNGLACPETYPTNSCQVTGALPDKKSHKRGMSDICLDPPKYFRPHDAGQYSLGEMSGHHAGQYSLGGMSGHHAGQYSLGGMSGHHAGQYSLGGMSGHHAGQYSLGEMSGHHAGQYSLGEMSGHHAGQYSLGGMSGHHAGQYSLGEMSGHHAGQYSLGGMSGDDACNSSLKMVSHVSQDQMSGGILYTSESTQPCPHQIFGDPCGNPELNDIPRFPDLLSDDPSDTFQIMDSFQPQPGSKLGHDYKEHIIVYEDANLNLQQGNNHNTVLPPTTDFKMSLNSQLSGVYQRSAREVQVVVWDHSHADASSEGSTCGFSSGCHPSKVGSATALYGSSVALRGSPTASHEPPTALCEPPTALHGPPTALCGPPTSLCGPSTSFCGPLTSLCGPPISLCGPPTSLCGPPTALCGPLTSLCGPPTLLCGPPTSLCGPPTSLCGPPTSLDVAPAALYGPPTSLDVAPAALCGPPTLLDVAPAALCGPPTTLYKSSSALVGSPARLLGSPPHTFMSLPLSNLSTWSIDSGMCSPMSETSDGHPSQINTAFSSDQNDDDDVSDDSFCDEDKHKCISENIDTLAQVLEDIQEMLEEQNQTFQITPPNDSNIILDGATSNRFGSISGKSLASSEVITLQKFQDPRQLIDGNRQRCASYDRSHVVNERAPESMTVTTSMSLPVSNIRDRTTIPSLQEGGLMIPVQCVIIVQQTPPAKTSPILYQPILPKIERAIDPSGKAVNSGSQACNSSVGSQVCNSNVGSQACNSNVGSQACNSNVGSQACNSNVGSQACNSNVGSQACNSNVGSQACNSNVGSQVCNSSANQSVKTLTLSPASGEQNKQRYTDDQKLHIARRLVASLSLDDLINVDDDDNEENNVIHAAVCQEDHQLVQALLERVVRENIAEMINTQNIQGQTPLYLAASTNKAEMVKVLVEYGADTNRLAESMTSCGTREKLGAIHCASNKGKRYLDTLKALLTAPGIDLNLLNSEGHTALNCSILSHGKTGTDNRPVNSISIIQALIHAGADPNVQVQQSGKTALMFALESRDLDLIEQTFRLVQPSKLSSFLKTQAFDGSTCVKIARSLRTNLTPAGQKRLSSLLKLTARRSSL